MHCLFRVFFSGQLFEPEYLKTKKTGRYFLSVVASVVLLVVSRIY